MESLEAFMKNLESIQLSIDNFGVSADLHDRFNAKQRDIAAFTEQQNQAKMLRPNVARLPQTGSKAGQQETQMRQDVRTTDED
jgi:hypothetical protein